VGPEQLRAAMADFVAAVHGAYLAAGRLLPPAEQGRLPLLTAGRFTVAAVGVRHLHVLATAESLGPVRAPEVEVVGAAPPLAWTLRFYDPVVLPALGLLAEADAPATAEVRAALGVHSTLYHLAVTPGAGLSPHHAQHAGTGLANAHAAAFRDLAALRAALPGREAEVQEFGAALAAGLPIAARLLAGCLLAGRGARGVELPVDPEALRRAVLAAVP
jgi:hypothetical protein